MCELKDDGNFLSAMDFPMAEILAYHARKHGGDSDDLSAISRELKRYLYLAAKNRNLTFPMPKPVDELWHTFILFTENYTNFCNLIAGCYIHHYPKSTIQREHEIAEVCESILSYYAFLDLYEDTFGEEPPTKYWPLPVGSNQNSELKRNLELTYVIETMLGKNNVVAVLENDN